MPIMAKLLTAAGLLFLTCTANADRFLAVYDDGSVLTGGSLNNTFGWSALTNAPSIGDLPIVKEGTNLRCIRDLQNPRRLSGPCIVMANGDILPGQIVGVERTRAEASFEESLLVRMAPPLVSWNEESSILHVRLDRVARIVSDASNLQELPPGTVKLADGRSVEFQAFRWGEKEYRLLTKDDVVRGPYSGLKDFHARLIDRWSAIQEDIHTPCPDPKSPLVRIELPNGAVLTCKRTLYVELGHNVLAVQPAWAYSGIRFDTGEVTSRSYRSLDEIPLTLLESTTLSQHSFTGFEWRWKRNRNVRGGILHSGALSSAQGLGTHSYSAIAFELPPSARLFSTWIGLDQGVGDGGCVRCSIYGDIEEGKPLWQGSHLRGSDPPVYIDKLNIEGFKRLILVTDFGHEGRPEGADPMDLRDEVDWIEPMVELSPVPRHEMKTAPVQALQQLASWKIPDGMLDNPIPTVALDHWYRQWTRSVFLNVPEEIRIKRQVAVSKTNAWFQLSASRSRQGVGGHELIVMANNELLETLSWTLLGRDATGRKDLRNLTTERVPAGTLHVEDYSLGKFEGQTVDLEVILRPVGNTGKHPLPLLNLRGLNLRSIVIDSPDGTSSIKPDVALSSLKPISSPSPEGPILLQAGRLINGQPLKIYDCRFNDGFGVPPGSELTYALDSDWGRFVAVIGHVWEAKGSTGPFEILLDGESHWKSTGRFIWNSRGNQIDISIPPGKKSITLKLSPNGGYGAWAEAGFMRAPR
ncbi:MAG: NPCBM/NEW2 domain-containing protein [Kiritimatiellia bacterium]|jgi:hypothetical protein|nr:NPCBM/NEW2 domain-containing protein [Kiritimatiellia bacterium]